MYLGFALMAASLVLLAFTATDPVGLLVGVFLVGGSASALSPTIQTRLMDIARDSQSIAAALNHSALNIGNSLGAILGGAVIAAGLGYVAPVWVGLALTVAGAALALASFALASFALDRARSRRGIPMPSVTGAVPAID